MSRTETDKETRGDEYCLERTDFETCRKSVWSSERRERLASHIGDRLTPLPCIPSYLVLRYKSRL